jgi:hypothetical protein
MRTRTRPGRLLWTAGAALTLAGALLVPVTGHAAAGESLTVNVSSTRGPSTGVGEGFLYGFTEDGTQPVDQFIQPLGIYAFRGGGWFSGGWIKDGYQNGAATKADLNSMTEEASAHPAALPRAVPGAAHRHLRPERRAAREHDVPVRQRPCTRTRSSGNCPTAGAHSRPQRGRRPDHPIGPLNRSRDLDESIRATTICGVVQVGTLTTFDLNPTMYGQAR